MTKIKQRKPVSTYNDKQPKSTQYLFECRVLIIAK